MLKDELLEGLLIGAAVSLNSVGRSSCLESLDSLGSLSQLSSHILCAASPIPLNEA